MASEVVRNKKFYHIQRKAPIQFEKGIKYFTDKKNNFFNQFYASCPWFRSKDGESYPINQIVKALIEYYVENKEKRKELDSLYEDIPSILKLIDEGIVYITMMLRELVLENIRQKLFPDKPSRLYCIWLINNEDSLKFWKNKLEGQQYFIYLLSVNGKIHTGNSEYLKNEIVSLTEYEENAKNYWLSVEINTPKDEVIFMGEFLVEKVIKA